MIIIDLKEMKEKQVKNSVFMKMKESDIYTEIIILFEGNELIVFSFINDLEEKEYAEYKHEIDIEESLKDNSILLKEFDVVELFLEKTLYCGRKNGLKFMEDELKNQYGYSNNILMVKVEKQNCVLTSSFIISIIEKAKENGFNKIIFNNDNSLNEIKRALTNR